MHSKAEECVAVASLTLHCVWEFILSASLLEIFGASIWLELVRAIEVVADIQSPKKACLGQNFFARSIRRKLDEF
jgi:hypothetical protein